MRTSFHDNPLIKERYDFAPPWQVLQVIQCAPLKQPGDTQKCYKEKARHYRCGYEELQGAERNTPDDVNVEEIHRRYRIHPIRRPHFLCSPAHANAVRYIKITNTFA